jgi:transposase
MRGFVQGADRQQRALLPECLDDWVDEGNSVRAVDVFVDALELRDLGFDGVDPAATGRPAYHPSPMLKLYIYGYLNRVQSSRRLEREAGRNLEVMWLTGRLAPDHKTIADFRKDNGPAIKKVCAQFVELCRKMGLLAKASVAIDGSKFKAVNSRDNNFTQGKIQRRQKQIEESVARYMSQLDTADRQTAAGEEPSETVQLTKTRLKEKLAKLEEEVKRLAVIEKALLASPDLLRCSIIVNSRADRPVSVGPQVACKVRRRTHAAEYWVGVVQPAVFAQAARSESTIKSRVIGTASRLVDSSI